MSDDVGVEILIHTERVISDPAKLIVEFGSVVHHIGLVGLRGYEQVIFVYVCVGDDVGLQDGRVVDRDRGQVYRNTVLGDVRI